MRFSPPAGPRREAGCDVLSPSRRGGRSGQDQHLRGEAFSRSLLSKPRIETPIKYLRQIERKLFFLTQVLTPTQFEPMAEAIKKTWLEA